MKSSLHEKLSVWQFFLLIFIFETGSSVVVGVGGEAKKDAWIAILLATFIGIFILLFYFYLIQKAEGRNLFFKSLNLALENSLESLSVSFISSTFSILLPVS
jgi:hypothetical protein